MGYKTENKNLENIFKKKLKYIGTHAHTHIYLTSVTDTVSHTCL